MWQMMALLLVGSFNFSQLGFQDGSQIQLPIQESEDSCMEGRWVGNPVLNDQNRLVATISSQCKIQTENVGNISTLNRNLLESIPKEYQVKTGPVSEVFEQMPSQRFDVSSDVRQGGDRLKISRILHLATDDTNRLIFESNSQSVQGSGNSAYLRILNLKEEVLNDPNVVNQFYLNVTQYVEVEKPWFAPGDVFISQAKAGIQKSFDEGMRFLVAARQAQLMTP